MAHRVLVADHRLVRKGWVLVALVGGGRRSGAKVQNPEDTVTQKQRTHKKKRHELLIFRPAEEPQEPVLPPTTRRCAHILSGLLPGTTASQKRSAPLGLRLLTEAQLGSMLKGESPW